MWELADWSSVERAPTFQLGTFGKFTRFVGPMGCELSYSFTASHQATARNAPARSPVCGEDTYEVKHSGRLPCGRYPPALQLVQQPLVDPSVAELDAERVGHRQRKLWYDDTSATSRISRSVHPKLAGAVSSSRANVVVELAVLLQSNLPVHTVAHLC